MIIFQWDSPSGASAQASNFNTNRAYSGSNQSSAGNMQSQNQRWPTPGPIQRPSNSSNFNVGSPSSQFVNYQNYQNSHYQQRPMRNSIASSSGMSMSQGKSQYFNPTSTGTKRELNKALNEETSWIIKFSVKTDIDKMKSQGPSSPTKAPADSKGDWEV